MSRIVRDRRPLTPAAQLLSQSVGVPVAPTVGQLVHAESTPSQDEQAPAEPVVPEIPDMRPVDVDLQVLEPNASYWSGGVLITLLPDGGMRVETSSARPASATLVRGASTARVGDVTIVVLPPPPPAEDSTVEQPAEQIADPASQVAETLEREGEVHGPFAGTE